MTRLEKATNVAIIVDCTVLVGSLTRNYHSSSGPKFGLRPEIAKGAVVNLPGVVPLSPQSTLALTRSKSCHFCQEGVGFYKRLTAFKNSFPQGLRMVAVLPEGKRSPKATSKKQDRCRRGSLDGIVEAESPWDADAVA